MMRRRTVRRVAFLTAAVAALGCGVSDEAPAGGDPKQLALAAAAATPVADPPATPVSTEVPPPVVEVHRGVVDNVTYRDAEEVFRSGNYGEAADLFEAYTVRWPENAGAHYMLGIAAWKAGDHGRAERALLRTIELDPDHAKALTNLGRVLLEQGRARAALDYAEEASLVAPGSADAWRVVGNVRSSLGTVESAVEAYQRALVLDAEDAWTMNNLGLLMIRSGRFEEALPPLARATELKPGTAVFQNNLGVALERSGHLVEAAEAFRAALDASPENAKAKQSLVRVEERIVDGPLSPVDLKGLASAFADEILHWRQLQAARESGAR
jgi:Flp pilus assembly protein TadD